MNSEASDARIGYDELYSKIDMITKPFGYSKDYLIWRSSKIKSEISKFIKNSGSIFRFRRRFCSDGKIFTIFH